MGKNIEKLHSISTASSKRIIGLMSGTSLDGLDIAHCLFQGHGPDTQVELLHFTTVPYTPDVKAELRKVLSVRRVDLSHLCDVHTWLGQYHGKLILSCLSKWSVSPSSVDIIASHGQTVYHSPKSVPSEATKFGDSTLQIGDGDQIAVTTGITTISDFRQKHTAAGGQGAPLALYGDYFIFSKPGENRILVNIGGIANITCLYGDLDCKTAFATDLGPGNTLIDAWVRTHFGCDFDHNSKIAQGGTLNEELLRNMKSHPFFQQPFPKTTGPELFNLEFVNQALASLVGGEEAKLEDVVTTLTMLTADVIITSVKFVVQQETENEYPFKVYCSGGGAHNCMLMHEIRKGLQGTYVGTTEELGIPGDAKEAVLFAALANETLSGEPDKYQFGGGGGRTPSISMGKISFPE